MKRLLLLVVLVVTLGTGALAAPAAQAITASISDPVATDVTATNPDGTEGTGANTTMTFRVSLSAPAPQGGVSMGYTTIGGTATAGVDYQSASGTLSIAEGQLGGDIVVTVIGDALDEADETFTVALNTFVPAGTLTPGDAIGLGTIPDDDDPPSITVADAVVQGGAVTTGTNRLVIFEVKLSAPSGRTVTVDYGTVDDTAIACTKTICDSPDDGDYVPLTGTLTFNPGVTSLQVSVVAIGDSLDVNKQFRFTLKNVTHLRSPSTTFRPSDVGKTVTIRPGTAQEAVTTITGVTPNNPFDVTLADPVDNGLSVPFSFVPSYTDGVVNNTTLTSTTARFVSTDVGTAITVAGDPNTIVTVNTANQVTLAQNPGVSGGGIDFSYRVDKSGASLLGGVHQTLARAEALGHINSAGPLVSIANATVAEGPAGRVTNVALTVTLDNASPQALSVAYGTADGTAKAPADYAATSGRLTFAPGETKKTIVVAVRGNDIHDGERTFTVVLKEPIDVRLATSGTTATVRIADDDAAPRVRIAEATVPEPRSGTGNVDVVVALTSASGRPIEVAYRTEDGTAKAGAHYQKSEGKLTFAPGETSRKIPIPVAGDGVVTDDLTFSVVATDTDGSPVRATVRIVDSDLTEELMPTVGVNDATVRTDGAASVARFTVRLDRPLTRTVRVSWRTVDGSAKAGRDYAAGTGVLVIAPGQLTATVEVPVLAADRPRNRTFTVRLFAPVSTRLGDDTGHAILIPTGESPLAASVAGRSVRSTAVLCRRGRPCPGLRVRWAAPSAGRVRVQILAVFPPQRRSSSRSKAEGTTRVLADRRVTVKRPGRGSAAVRRGAGTITNRLVRQLRAVKVRNVTVRVTHVDRLGRQRAFSRTLRLRN